MVELPEEVKNMSTEKKPAESPVSTRPTGPSARSSERRGERPQGARPYRQAGVQGERGGRRPAPRRRRLFGGGKVCHFCVNKVKYVDYKNVDSYRRYVTGQGKIQPRRLSGVCARHQRMACRAIKRARVLALLPFKVM